MDILKEYNKIIDNRIINQLEKGSNTELHHIKPRKFFEEGTTKEIINRPENLVYLTQEEHFKVHYYLKEYYKELKENNHKDYNKRYYLVSLKGFEAMGLKDTTFINIECNAKLYEQGKQDIQDYYKEENIKYIKEICEFKLKYNRNPKQKVYGEKHLFKRLFKLKKFRKDGDYLFYDEYQKIADSYGLNDLFDYIDYEKITLGIIKEICEFKKQNGFNPRMDTRNDIESISDIEHKLGCKLSKLRLSFKNNKSSVKWYDSYQKIADIYGYSDLFDSQSIEDQILNKLNKICDYIDINGYTIPKLKNNSDEERSLVLTLTNLRANHKKGNLIKRYYDLIEERGYPDLFEPRKYTKLRTKKKKVNNTITREEKGIIKLNELFDFVDKYNRKPKQNGDKIEINLYHLYLRYKSKNGLWYDSFDELILKRNKLNILKF